MALNTVQVIQLAAAAGFPRDTLVTVAGIAWRESRNNPGAVGDVNNPKPGCRSLGLMQINVCPQYNNAGSWFRQQSETDPNHVLLDPAQNMRAAKELYDDRGFRPWTTYRSGIPAPDTARIESDVAAAGGLDAVIAGAPAAAAGLAGTAGTLGASSSSTGGAFDLFRQLLDPATWVRVGLVVAGAGAVAAALYLIARDQGLTSRGAAEKLLAAREASPADPGEAANMAPTPDTPPA